MIKVDRNHPELPRILEKLPNIIAHFMVSLKDKGFDTHEPEKLAEYIFRHIDGSLDELSLYTVGPCIVAITVAAHWWAPSPMLVEELIVRYKPGDFADTVKGLEQHALSLGCKTLVISSLAQRRGDSYGEYLKRKGFREVAREYVKGL